MRALAISAMILISLGFTGLSAPSTGLAQEACRCKGCGCKGGSGWRGPDGACVSTAKLAEDQPDAGRHALQAGGCPPRLFRQAGGV
jgi:hypothetical protein